MTSKFIDFTKFNKLKSKGKIVSLNKIEIISPRNIGVLLPSNAGFFTLNNPIPQSAIPSFATPSFVILSSVFIQALMLFIYTMKDIQRLTKIYLDLFFWIFVLT